MRAQVGLSQEELGNAIGVTRQTVAAWENDPTRQPSIAQLNLAAKALGLPLTLLLSADDEPENHLLFRADDPACLTPALRAILAKKASDYAAIEKLARERGVVPESRPMDGAEDNEFVEQTASQIRGWLGMGESNPLGDVLALLEARGLKVIRHPLAAKLAGFSAYTENWGAIIVINEEEPTERQYFTALHELGHLIFHRLEYKQPQAIKGKIDPREKAANLFAGAVLLPSDAIRQELQAYRNRPWIPEPLLQDIKQRYWVSMRTVLMRAHQVGCISKEQAGRQIGSLNSKYGRDSEGAPLALPKHLSRLQRLVYRCLLSDEITTARAAEVLNLSIGEVRDQLEGWAEGERAPA